MYICQFDGADCFTSHNSDNNSILITGRSGSGKSYRQCIMELYEARHGSTVIVFDFNTTRIPSRIPENIRSGYMQHVNYINIATDGLNLHLLGKAKNYTENDCYRITTLATSILSAGQNFGTRQLAILEDAVKTALALKKRENHTDADAIFYSLKAYSDSEVGLSVFQQLKPILKSTVFDDGDYCILPGKINIIDLSDVAPRTIKRIAELVLAYIFEFICQNNRDNTRHFLISIDEMQRLSLDENSSLATLLLEGRKFNANLLLATQTTEKFSPAKKALLNQVATRLYFRPSSPEITSVAKLIHPSDYAHWKKQLTYLDRGEFIITGLKTVGVHDIERPIIIKEVSYEYEYDCICCNT